MPDDLISYLLDLAYPWLLEQRDQCMAGARPLSVGERLWLQDYYDRRILDMVRLATVDRITNPPFYADLIEAGRPVMDLSGALGITLIDCVVVRKFLRQDSDSWLSLLFHELVHVVQFDILGSRGHLEAYLRGWADNGYQYHNVPLEVQAHRLEARFTRQEPHFDVRGVVEREIKKHNIIQDSSPQVSPPRDS